MKKNFIFVLIALPIFAYLIYLMQFQLQVRNIKIKNPHPESYYDYRGVTHVHSNLSVGTESQEEIIKTAIDVGLDYLVFTEFNTMKNSTHSNKYNENLIVLSGGEFSHLDDRYLFYNIPPKPPPHPKGQAQIYMTDFLSRKDHVYNNGFMVMAHPLIRDKKNSTQIPQGLMGIEVINFKSMIEKKCRHQPFTCLISLLLYPINNRLAWIRLYSEPKDELQLWNTKNQDSPLIGFLGNDATANAKILPNFSLKFPSYKTSLSMGSNHILISSELTGDYESDKYKIFKALFNGNFYMSMDFLADPKGFNSTVLDNKKRYLMGEKIPFKKSLRMEIQLPSGLIIPHEINIYRDGEKVLTSNKKRLSYLIPTKGQYHVQVRVIPFLPLLSGKRWLTWIYTNKFYIQ